MGGGTFDRTIKAVATGGLSEWTHGTDAFGLRTATNKLGITSSYSPSPLQRGPGSHDPITFLAESGGAPVLAQVAMGVNPRDALAGYMGIPSEQFEEYLKGLNPKDANVLTAVQNQLQTIQSDRNLRDQAVQQIINDFPNIANQVARTRTASGMEFDELTKGYMDQAIRGRAAGLAANGLLSSGAANEAFSRVGAEHGINKLRYMDERGNATYNDAMINSSLRLDDATRRRGFADSMLGLVSRQNAIATQSNLDRGYQSDTLYAKRVNEQSLLKSANDNKLLGAITHGIGSLGTTYAIGSYLNANKSNDSSSNLGSTSKY